ncbi:MAG: rubrerythrin family protein [Firmicutes bacterium]|nr:rubrerythrin family protein [Bacillota bacterium]
MNKNNTTAANLRSAFGGESMAHMRYLAWGADAKKQGFPHVARLFEAVAYAEQIHAHAHFQELKNITGDFLVPAMAGFGKGTVVEHLQWAKAGEDYEINEMYPAFAAVAELQGEKGALRAIRYALEAEKNHSELFGKAADLVADGQDFPDVPIVVCPVCGHTREGDAPERCPICGVPGERFARF